MRIILETAEPYSIQCVKEKRENALNIVDGRSSVARCGSRKIVGYHDWKSKWVVVEWENGGREEERKNRRAMEVAYIACAARIRSS